MRHEPEMIAIPGGIFRVGSDEHYPEERPARDVEVTAFRIDRTPVTNRAFAAFVDATGYRTIAEQLDPPGSAVFAMTDGPVDLHVPSHWWRFVAGASWRAPEGPGSNVDDRGDHPVVHVARTDAERYAEWRDKRLPTEVEWEVAARGRLIASPFAWGNEFAPNGRLKANVWTGAFPWHFAREGSPGTTPVDAFPQNGYGLSDMIGNVWEWTSSPFAGEVTCSCSAASDGGLVALKGGSFLCAGEYCARYRPAARIGLTPESTAANVGLRCARSAA